MSQDEVKCNVNYVCVNCGQGLKKLYKKYSNTVKTVNCDKCLKVADKYIEFEPVIIIVDSMLLSQRVYRHVLYNQDFKLFWKLSLMLLLLESLTLWREKNEGQLNGVIRRNTVAQEHGFYFCCAQKIGDFILCTLLLVIITFTVRPTFVSNTGVKQYSFLVLKANTLANLSKFFLLPIMLWRENTSEFRIWVTLHRNFVTAHHLCSLVLVYMVVSRCRCLQAILIVLPIYVVKEIVMQYIEGNHNYHRT